MATPEIKNPNIDRISPETPEAETGVSQPTRGPDGEPAFEPEIDPDRGAERPEIEDDLGRSDKPEMVPPGQTVDRNRESEIERGGATSGMIDLDPDALAADRAVARSSDAVDGRDGVDASDQLARDPDSVGGKVPKGQLPSLPA